MFIRIGDKVAKATKGANGKPVIKAQTETIKKPDGTQEVIVHVPCLKIQTKQELGVDHGKRTL